MSGVLFKNKVHIYKCKDTFVAKLWIYEGETCVFANVSGKGSTAIAARDDLIRKLVLLKTLKQASVEHLSKEIALIDNWQQKYQGEFTESEMTNDPESLINEN